MPDEEEFVDRLLGGLGSHPGYFLRLRDVNRAGPRIYGTDTPPLQPLDVETVDEVVAGGGLVVDVRPIASYAAGHIAGSLSIELRDSFATWLGWLVEDPATPLGFIRDPDRCGPRRPRRPGAVRDLGSRPRRRGPHVGDLAVPALRRWRVPATAVDLLECPVAYTVLDALAA